MKNRNDGYKLKSFKILRSFLRYEFVIDYYIFLYYNAD